MYLNCKTYFSYRYGIMSAEDLVQEALKYGVQALALTNINCTADHWDFLKFCNQGGIKPLLGVEIRNGDELLYIIIAKDLTGIEYIKIYQQLYFRTSSAKNSFSLEMHA
jgi:DNA polymerase III alpha subunit